MKKENIYKFLYAVGILLIIAFAIRLGVDYSKYDTVNNSAPFYVFIIERVVEYLLPAIAMFIAGKVTKNKYARNIKNNVKGN